MGEIDFVVPWVDGSDPAWQRKKAACLGESETDGRVQRYRDWGLLKYWFRGVETFAPWVRKVWFICDQDPPAWLNREHPKLEIIRHEEYIPAKYLPAFNANVIELNLHRIEGLSERFVYFNDDMHLIASVGEDFFFRKGLPRDSALLNPVPTTDLTRKSSYQRIITVHLNNAEYANRDYDFRSTVKKHFLKWYNIRYGGSLIRNLMLSVWPRFVGFYEPHLPQPFLKSAFGEAWEADGDILEETCRHSIRNDRDVNQWLIRHRLLIEGRFVPRKPLKGAVFDLKLQPEETAAAIREQRLPMICINDGEMEESEFWRIQEVLVKAFESILPEKSAFEWETVT
ncbi:MAG: Stealth CR1 domain-containing protein [Clostridia bacterium]|nr:Stealth CR1 domain-containing protein [Clostridia bacterium]